MMRRLALGLLLAGLSSVASAGYFVHYTSGAFSGFQSQCYITPSIAVGMPFVGSARYAILSITGNVSTGGVFELQDVWYGTSGGGGTWTYCTEPGQGGQVPSFVAGAVDPVVFAALSGGVSGGSSGGGGLGDAGTDLIIVCACVFAFFAGWRTGLMP